MRKLVAIDPGATTGIAFYQDATLVRAFSGACIRTQTSFLPQDWTGWDAIIEEPRHYPGSKSSPNDLMKLTARAYGLGTVLRVRGAIVEFVAPRTWKRSTPKPIHHARAREVLAVEERTLVGGLKLDHNAWDAIALGLWKLGRLRHDGR